MQRESLSKTRNKRVKLIFNPTSGANSESPLQLMDVIQVMQTWKLLPEPFLIEPNCDLNKVVREAITQGIQMFVVCGGDGTTTAVARALVGTNATLGIIPTGTQNNVALSLGIQKDIQAAIAILRNGKKAKIDIGIATINGISTPFFELCSIGLFSSLFSVGDDIQHGNLLRIGDFLATLTGTPPSEIHLVLDDQKEVKETGHLLLVSNMPYIFTNFQIGSLNAFQDGLLDVLFFADLTKLDLIGYVLKGEGKSDQEDARIQHYRVRKITVDTKPNMPVMVDGIDIGTGLVQIEIRRHAFSVMVEEKGGVK